MQMRQASTGNIGNANPFSHTFPRKKNLRPGFKPSKDQETPLVGGNANDNKKFKPLLV
jgi:hypothetical protein